MISAIVAYANGYVIGKTGELPWYLPEDLKHFKALTTGNTIIMGRKTYDSIGKALPNRQNIVISRQKDLNLDGVEVYTNPSDALKASKNNDVYIIGGGEIYQLFWQYLDTIHATIIEKEIEGDTFFPEFNLDDWKLNSYKTHHSDNLESNYSFAIFEKRLAKPILYYINAGRHLKQIAQMEDLEDRKVCFFCPKHFNHEHGEPISLETKYWYVTLNDYPYKDTSLHLLVVPKEHVNRVRDLSSSAKSEFLEVISTLENKYKLKSYGQFMRVGDFHYNGATVYHLHAHIVVPDYTNPNFNKLKVKLGTPKTGFSL